jgi:hypothetical protein
MLTIRGERVTGPHRHGTGLVISLCLFAFTGCRCSNRELHHVDSERRTVIAGAQEAPSAVPETREVERRLWCEEFFRRRGWTATIDSRSRQELDASTLAVLDATCVAVEEKVSVKEILSILRAATGLNIVVVLEKGLSQSAIQELDMSIPRSTARDALDSMSARCGWTWDLRDGIVVLRPL